jgi:hypothetical protein
MGEQTAQACANAWLQQLRITQPDELDDGQWGVTYAPTVPSRTPPWLPSGSGYRSWGRRLSRGEKYSLRQAHASEHGEVARIGAERIHRLGYLDELQAPCLLGIGFLQPIEGLILVAESRVRVCNIRGIDIAPLSQLLSKLNSGARFQEVS